MEIEMDWDALCHDSLVHIFGYLLPSELGPLALVCQVSPSMNLKIILDPEFFASYT